MRDSCTRRTALAVALGVVAGLASGCQSNEIPLVEFPKGAPPPPPPSKDAKPPQGSATSGVDPMLH